jgi:ABC-type phosphate transport system substrate-binding protein
MLMKILNCCLFLLLYFSPQSILAEDPPPPPTKIALAGEKAMYIVVEPYLQKIEQELNIKLEVNLNDEKTAVQNVIQGLADVAMISTELKTLLQGTGINPESMGELKIIESSIIFIVNQNNKVRSISGDDVKSILYGSFINWKSLGGDDMEILVVTDPRGTGIRSFIENSFLASPISIPVKQMVSSDQIIEVVERVENAVGMIDEMFLTSNVRALNMTHRIKHPLIFAFRAKRSDSISRFISAINKIKFTQRD